MNIVIVCCDKNGAIGKNGGIPWTLRSDMKHFKKKTTHEICVMGRKTYESLPTPKLPKRKKIVLSKNKEFSAGESEVYFDFYTFMRYFDPKGKDMYFIGGEEIYRMAIPICDKMFFTEVDAVIQDADAHFPEIDWSEWELVKEKKYEVLYKGDFCFNQYPFSIKEYNRKKI
jgi:dihydrofolate reductase